MAEYIVAPIETDPDVLEQRAVEAMKLAFPGWEANEAALATWQIRAIAQMVATARDLAADVPVDIFMYYGDKIASIPPIDALPASALSTWTMRDNAGYTIPAGLEVGIEDASGEIQAFQVVSDVVVPAGSTVTGAGEVRLIAVEPGTSANGLLQPVTLLDPLDFVTGVALTAAASGGVDAETVEDYTNRLTSELQLMAPRPILARDFAVLARRVSTVYRAVALDLYNPDKNTWNNERTVTVVAVQEDGTKVSAATRTAIENDLKARREANFVVFTMDPTYTAVDVRYDAVAAPGYDPADVRTRATAALGAYLAPRDWGKPRIGSGDPREWSNTPVVRKFEVAEVLNRVEGLDYLTALTMRIGTNAFAEADITLPGVVPMPTAGAITGTVAAP